MHPTESSPGLVLAFLIFNPAAPSLAAATSDAAEHFENRIRPVLVERCYECHSAGSKSLKGGLRLDWRDGVLRGGDSGKPVVVPGEPERSLLLQAIRRTNPDLKMPPKEALSPAVIADFESWIRQGAFDPRTNGSPGGAMSAAMDSRGHWAFQRPKDPPVPKVRGADWTRTPIDHFILERLDAQGLGPAPRARKRDLIRRASYDLCGLPPSLEEVQAFIDDASPEAFDRVIDRLLASPRYGERWGRHWLDVARYSDTKGYVYYYEESRFVHPHAYRDWVIHAINEDLPYDQFLLAQIAGDQLAPVPTDCPASTDSASTLRWPTPVLEPSAAALGFLTLGRRFLDLEPDIIDDRIDVLMRGTQALTVGCARCHDHKFDPIPTRDYYSLYGVFQSSEERLVALEAAPAPDQVMEFARAKAYVRFEDGVRERVLGLEAKFKAACEEVANRLRSRVGDYLVAVLDVAKLPSDANVRPQPEDINPFNVRQWERYLDIHAIDTDPLFAPWHAFAAVPADRFVAAAQPLARQFSENDPVRINPLVAGLFESAPTNMTDVAARYGQLFASTHRLWQSLLASNSTAQTRIQCLTNANQEAVRQVLYGPEAPVLAPPGTIVELAVHLYFDDPNRVALAKLQMELEQWIITNAAAPLHAVILQDRAHPVTPVVFRRGDPLKPSEPVPRQFLEILAGESRRAFQQGSGRLELARAIASPLNPLTARVLVNRVWAHHFGEGLVRTPSDFGLRCDPPTHPELLDWLACRFVEGGWSLKKLHRLIMKSAVYQQACDPPVSEPGSSETSESEGPPAGASDTRDAGQARSGDDGKRAIADPENRLLGHFSRQRLDFESFRDSLLAVGGDLDERMGGPAVELHQAPFSQRRTVYGLIDRKLLPAMFRSFDFANPDVHSARRHATTMPQQALFLLNHPFMTARARALAHRLDPIPDRDVEARVTRLYGLAFQRPPTATQLADARAFLNSAAEPDPPVTAGGSPPPKPDGPLLDRWEALAQVLLLSNEFMFVD